MWDTHRRWCCTFIPKTLLHKQPDQSLLPLTQNQNDAVCSSCISLSAVAGMLPSWLDRRWRRYLFLILCSPFLLPLICATCPFICAVEICCLFRRRRKVDSGGGVGRGQAEGGGGGRGRGEDGGDEVGLLQRYLEDQLLLVVESVYECGDEDGNVGEEDGADVEYFDSTRPLLQ